MREGGWGAEEEEARPTSMQGRHRREEARTRALSPSRFINMHMLHNINKYKYGMNCGIMKINKYSSYLLPKIFRTNLDLFFCSKTRRGSDSKAICNKTKMY